MKITIRDIISIPFVLLGGLFLWIGISIGGKWVKAKLMKEIKSEGVYYKSK